MVIGDNLCGITGAGDGIGGSEIELDEFPQSLIDCAILVKSQYPNATGATTDWPNGNGHCYAEFGQTSRNNDVDYTNVQFVDCPVSILLPVNLPGLYLFLDTLSSLWTKHILLPFRLIYLLRLQTRYVLLFFVLFILQCASLN